MESIIINNSANEIMKLLTRSSQNHEISFNLNERMNRLLNEYAQKLGLTKNEAAQKIITDVLTNKLAEYMQEQSWV